MIEIVNQKITNADRIRGMTEEELAAVIHCPELIGEKNFRRRRECYPAACNKCKLYWLRQEVEQGVESRTRTGSKAGGKAMTNNTCETCIDNDCGLCDRYGRWV